MNALKTLKDALAHHRAGRLAEAERGYRAVLKAAPADPDAPFLLGTLLAQAGRGAEALALLERAAAARPDNPAVLNSLGLACRVTGNLAGAEAAHRRAMAIRPDDPAAYGQLALVLRARGDLAGAMEQHAAALARNPNLAEEWFHLGTCRKAAQDLAGAAQAFRKAVTLRPAEPAFQHNLGQVLGDMGYFPEAIAHIREAARLDPNSDALVMYLAELCRHSGDLAAARAHGEAALARWPKSPLVRARLAGILETAGEAEAAHGLIAELVEKGDPEAVAVFADVSRKLGREAEAVERVEAALSGQAGTDQRIVLHFAAGRLLDRLDEYDRAFAHFKAGNDLQDHPFDPERYRAGTDALMSAFDRNAMARLPRASLGSDLPLFIVGMPRSGTTLTEQILASHPLVAGGGELLDLNLIAARMGGAVPFPDCLEGMTPADMDRWAGEYLATLRRIGPGATRVTDKMPTNFRHLGLIALLFPGAPVVHCTRNPVDACLSIYFQPFTRGHGYARNLAQLGFVYGEYRRLMTHWRETLDAQPLDFPYEETVADQAGQTRRLLDFCGLPWDDACLAFHKSGRKVVTHSYDQVRRPIYDRSVARWRRYERHLAPLLEALGPDADLG